MTMAGRVFRLGIVGGCMTHQSGIPLSKLFHRQLAASLLARTGITLQPRVARDFERPYAERLVSLQEQHELDGVLLHIRVAMAVKSTLLSRHSANGTARYYLHPFLLNRRQVGWASAERAGMTAVPMARRPAAVPGPVEHRLPSPGRRILGFRVNDLNLILGHMVGLDRWAIRDELASLTEFLALCRSRQLPVVVLGPTAVAGSWATNRLTTRLNAGIRSVVAPLGVPFCAVNSVVDESGRVNLLPDGHHLNEDGHRYVANQLSKVIEPWIRDVPRPEEASETVAV